MLALCASVGTPFHITTVRDECKIGGTKTAFTLDNGVFVDENANAAFTEAADDLSDVTQVCLYNSDITEDNEEDALLLCSSLSLEDGAPAQPTAVDRLLGYHVAKGEPMTGPCFWSNDLVESCAFDSTLEIKTDYTLQCNDVPVNAKTSCANPRCRCPPPPPPPRPRLRPRPRPH